MPAIRFQSSDSRLIKARLDGSLVHAGDRVHFLGFAGYSQVPQGESCLVNGSRPVSNQSHAYTSMPPPISAQGLVVLGSTLYALGGYNGAFNSAISDIYAIPVGSLTSNSKQSLRLNVARSHPAVVRTDNRVYILGGQAGSQKLSTVEIATLSSAKNSIVSIATASALPAPVAGPVVNLDSSTLTGNGSWAEGARVRMLSSENPARMVQLTVSGGELVNAELLSLEGVPESFTAGEVTLFRYKNLEFLLAGSGEMVYRKADSSDPFQDAGATLPLARHRPMLLRTQQGNAFIVGGHEDSEGRNPRDTMIELIVGP